MKTLLTGKKKWQRGPYTGKVLHPLPKPVHYLILYCKTNWNESFLEKLLKIVWCTSLASIKTKLMLYKITGQFSRKGCLCLSLCWTQGLGGAPLSSLHLLHASCAVWLKVGHSAQTQSWGKPLPLTYSCQHSPGCGCSPLLPGHTMIHVCSHLNLLMYCEIWNDFSGQKKNLEVCPGMFYSFRESRGGKPMVILLSLFPLARAKRVPTEYLCSIFSQVFNTGRSQAPTLLWADCSREKQQGSHSGNCSQYSD